MTILQIIKQQFPLVKFFRVAHLYFQKEYQSKLFDFNKNIQTKSY